MTHLMIDEDSLLPVHAYLDGELDTMNALAVEERMSIDSALAAQCERIDALQRLMHGHLRREALPPGLRRRIESAVGTQRSRTQFVHTQFSWRALAASIAVTAFVASSSTSMLLAPSRSNLVRDGIVDAHLRALMASQPIDVASSDQHTVKPWFNGRLDVSPPVIDLTSKGFNLVGGRLDYIDARAIGAVVYRRRQHVINLFVAQTANTERRAAKIETIQGFNIRRWSDRGLNYWAISDIGADELSEFGEKFEAAVQTNSEG
jgi:anti-sigma factor RsiW